MPTGSATSLEEPFIREYSQGNMDAWLGHAGFETVRTEDVFWVNQLSYGRKPLPVKTYCPPGSNLGIPERKLRWRYRQRPNPLERRIFFMWFNVAARTWLRWLAIALLGLAIGFRFSHLGYKVYWHDEVFTSLRVAGYFGQEVSDRLFTGEIFSATDLLQYQQLPPDVSLAKTWASLVDHPEHPPAYYLLAYGWGRLLGASVTGYRGIAALFGVLALPLVFILGRRLFPGRPVLAWVGLVLFAVSPVQLIYSQEAREYSFWVVGMLVATLTLLRAVRHPNRSTWLGYSVGLTLSLYGSLVTVLLGLSHLIFVVLTQKPRQWLNFALASSGALVLFSPWLWVLGQNWHRFQTVTAWTQKSSPMGILAKLWGLHYSATLVDFKLAPESPLHYAGATSGHPGAAGDIRGTAPVPCRPWNGVAFVHVMGAAPGYHRQRSAARGPDIGYNSILSTLADGCASW